MKKAFVYLQNWAKFFLYVLVSKLEKGIRQFLELTEKFYKQYEGFIRSDEDGKILKMKLYFFEELKPNYNQIDDFNLIFHLLAKTNSSLIMQDWNNNIEIHISKIKKMLDTLKIFEFSKVDL